MVTHATSLDEARLQFTDSASCKRWIESVPLTNLQSAQSALTEQVALVRHARIVPAEMLRVARVPARTHTLRAKRVGPQVHGQAVAARGQ